VIFNKRKQHLHAGNTESLEISRNPCQGYESSTGTDTMDQFKILEIKQSVYEHNDRQAEALRGTLKKNKTFLLNLMSSPGSGKTTTVLRTIEALKAEVRIGVLEADIDSDVDARAVALTGAKVIQIHTGGMCHLNADMTRQSLEEMNTDGLDFVILENIGNLICPAEFDTGASKNAMILSVPEGDDKPLKYPHMFSIVDVLLINKIDAISMFDFDLKAVEARVKKLNPDIRVFPVSAKTGEGMHEWFDWIRAEVKEWNTI
jgi:hydrogenase nickel incorporation protein HypB